MFNQYRNTYSDVMAMQWNPVDVQDRNTNDILYTLDEDGVVNISGSDGQYAIDHVHAIGRQILRSGDWIIQIGDKYYVCSEILFSLMYQEV
jgi:hypothetical protein